MLPWSSMIMSTQYTCPTIHYNIKRQNTLKQTCTLYVTRLFSVQFVSYMFLQRNNLLTSSQRGCLIQCFKISDPVCASKTYHFEYGGILVKCISRNILYISYTCQDIIFWLIFSCNSINTLINIRQPLKEASLSAFKNVCVWLNILD